jgi:hypothetical protein
VQDAIRLNNLRAGSLTLHTLQEHLDTHQEQVKQTIHEALGSSHINTCRINVASPAASVMTPEDEYGMYYYDSKLLCVPKWYKFPQKSEARARVGFLVRGLPALKMNVDGVPQKYQSSHSERWHQAFYPNIGLQLSSCPGDLFCKWWRMLL